MSRFNLRIVLFQCLREELASRVNRGIQSGQIAGKHIEGMVHAVNETGLAGFVAAGGNNLVAPLGINRVVRFAVDRQHRTGIALGKLAQHIRVRNIVTPFNLNDFIPLFTT